MLVLARRSLAVLVLAVLSAALLALPVLPAAAAGSITLSPAREGDTAVRSGQAVAVSGVLPEEPLRAAHVQAVGEAGAVLASVEVASFVFRPARETGDYLSLEGTTLSGRRTCSPA